MATVRFSKELIERIVKQATAKMHPAIEKAQAQKPDASWGQRIYDTLFLEVKPVLAQLPAGWVKTVDNFEIGEVGSQHCGMTFTLASPQPWPYEFPASPLARKRSTYGESITLLDNLVWGEFHAEVVAYHQRVHEAVKRRKEFVDAVKSICNTYSTLAPALKAWPPLWELIPEDVKDRHRQVVERAKKEVKLEVDLSKLTALSTAAKFGLWSIPSLCHVSTKTNDESGFVPCADSSTVSRYEPSSVYCKPSVNKLQQNVRVSSDGMHPNGSTTDG